MSACPSGGVEEHYIGEHQLFSCFGKLLYLYPSISLADATNLFYPVLFVDPTNSGPQIAFLSFLDTIPTQSLPRRPHETLLPLSPTSLNIMIDILYKQILIVIIQECQRALDHSWEEIKRSTICLQLYWLHVPTLDTATMMMIRWSSLLLLLLLWSFFLFVVMD